MIHEMGVRLNWGNTHSAVTSNACHGTTKERDDWIPRACDGNLTLCCSIWLLQLDAWVPTGSQFGQPLLCGRQPLLRGSKVSWNCCATTEILFQLTVPENAPTGRSFGDEGMGSCQQNASLMLLHSAPNTCRKRLRLKLNLSHWEDSLK